MVSGSPPPASVSTARGGVATPEIIQNLNPCFAFFLGRCGHSPRACATRTPRASTELKGGVDVEGGCGRHDAFLLGLAVSRRLPGKKNEVSTALFSQALGKSCGGECPEDNSHLRSTWTIRFLLVPGKG